MGCCATNNTYSQQLHQIRSQTANEFDMNYPQILLEQLKRQLNELERIKDEMKKYIKTSDFNERDYLNLRNFLDRYLILLKVSYIQKIIEDSIQQMKGIFLKSFLFILRLMFIIFEREKYACDQIIKIIMLDSFLNDRFQNKQEKNFKLSTNILRAFEKILKSDYALSKINKENQQLDQIHLIKIEKIQKSIKQSNTKSIIIKTSNNQNQDFEPWPKLKRIPL